MNIKSLLEYTQSLNILYVEDNIEIAHNGKDILSHYFNSVDIAYDGEDGSQKYLNSLKQHHTSYDIVITDINMPKLNGVELSRLILRTRPEQAIVIMSGQEDSAYLMECINMGVSGFLSKPLDFKQLHMLLSRISQAIADRKFVVEHIDTLKNRNSKLENKNTQLNKAIDASVLVSKSNTKGIITYANQAFIEVSGYSLDELIGNSHNIVRHSDTEDELYHDMWKTIRSKKVWRGMLKNKAKDGHDYYVDVTIVPVLNAKNRISEFLSIRYEVTNLVLATRKAQESQMAKEQFLANMSHELRTPLTAILGFSQMIMARADTPEIISNCVSKINIAGINLLTQVNTILDLSKIESGQMTYQFDNFQLKPLFEELRVMLESQAKDKNISLIMPMIDKEEMHGDKLSIKQVFMNLLSNAIKFTAINTTVEISYTCNIEQKEHIFKVYDQGDGVDEKDIQTLFEPFYQGENSRINATPGTGLGLAICKRIVTDVHKGKIGVENIKNGGSCFYMTIPINS